LEFEITDFLLGRIVLGVHLVLQRINLAIELLDLGLQLLDLGQQAGDDAAIGRCAVLRWRGAGIAPQRRTAVIATGGLQLLDLLLERQNLVFKRDAFLALDQRLRPDRGWGEQGDGGKSKQGLAHEGLGPEISALYNRAEFKTKPAPSKRAPVA
jgi:hypothetical protein